LTAKTVRVTSLFDSVSFPRGPEMKNRFMLAPLTNQQSHADGTLSDDEYSWLTKRAEGGFGLTMTCASHVQRIGQGFAGQLGCFDDAHLPGLTRLASKIRCEDSVAIVQLHHAGHRSPAELIGEAPVCPSDDPATGARALTTGEVEQLVEDFIAAAVRCERAGFDGVELHGAHDYMICEFLSSELNRRTDRYGGSLENRSRLLLEIIDGIRLKCRSDFNLSVRLSPERFGMRTDEIREVYATLSGSGKVDFIDMSLWDLFKPGIDAGYENTRLVDVFAEIERGSTRLGVAGKLYSAEDCRRALDAGVDMVVIGRGAVLHHDFPLQVEKDGNFVVRTLPVPRAVLREEGLSEAFIGYMGNWKGFVGD
jgi:2,4-dienoyl-CoA reductase-like NADH-dependent reductase (Old Yellow Enzyme family)